MWSYLIEIFAAFFCWVFFITLIWRRRMISLVRCTSLPLFINHLWHTRRFLQLAIFVFLLLFFALLAELFGVLWDTFALDLWRLTLPCWIWFQLLDSRNFVLLVSTCTSGVHHFDKFHVGRRYGFEFGTDLTLIRKGLLFLLGLELLLLLVLLLAFLVFVQDEQLLDFIQKNLLLLSFFRSCVLRC